jgi:hypothetical protein
MRKTFRFGDWKYAKNIGNNDIVISKYLGKDTEVTIPAQINGKKVCCLDSFVFSGTPANVNVKRVVFSEGLERINFHALSSSGIQEVVLPSTMQEIDKMGFGENVQRVIVDPNNPFFFDIDGVLFRGKKGEKHLAYFPSGRTGTYRIPNEIVYIDLYAFYASMNLEKLIMPDSILALSDFSFVSCPKLRSMRLSPNIGRLKKSTFLNCPELTDVKVTCKIKTIAPDAFDECPKLKGINIQTRIPEQERYYGEDFPLR